MSEPREASDEPAGTLTDTADPEATGDGAERLSHADAAHEIAGRLHPDRGDLSNGDRAELRRISPEAPFTPTLWRLLLEYNIEEPPGWWRNGSQVWEKRWATLVMGMAHCAGLHDRSAPFGDALYDAGWAEGRLVRLLETPADRLHVPVRRLAQYLSSQSHPADWTAVSRLLFDSGEYAEETRLSIARDFYRAQYRDEEE
jgi:CRISPR system Cascade subunit CasB